MNKAYEICVIMNELHAVMDGTTFDYSDIDNILNNVVQPILKAWKRSECNYISEFAVGYITKNILPKYK